MSITVLWPNRPIVTLIAPIEPQSPTYNLNPQIIWSSAAPVQFNIAEKITVIIECQNPNYQSSHFEWEIKVRDNLYPGNQEIQEKWDLNPGETKNFADEIDVTSESMTMSITARVYGNWKSIPGDGDRIGSWQWDDHGLALTLSQDFQILVTSPPVKGESFPVDFIPMTILYCPPDQDMINAITQGTTYGTNLTMGDNMETTSSTTHSTNFNWGITMGGGENISKDPDVRATADFGVSGSQGVSNSTSQMSGSGYSSFINLQYNWDTTIIADNQRTIGRKYWGPLGDIFVILHNPTFFLRQKPDQTQWVLYPGPSPDAEVLILPAHKLLRPNGDPVATKMPQFVRKQILSLDPFIKNLDKFFPPDGSEPDLDLSLAADPTRDPSTGPYGLGATNRAALISRFSISNGVELDLSQHRSITVGDTNTNETEYTATVTDTSSLSASLNIGFFIQGLNIGGEVGGSSSQSTTLGVKIRYQSSAENNGGFAKTAVCKLVRNQNEADLNDIEVWWDKQFSTFMFRKVLPLYHLHGTVWSDGNYGVANIHVSLSLKGTVVYTTMTDNTGRFTLKNIAVPGTYQLQVGDKIQQVTITAKNTSINPKTVTLTGVKRIVDPTTAPFWEMSQVGISPTAAVAIKTGLRKARGQKLSKFYAICKEHKIDVKELKTRAIIKLEKKSRTNRKTKTKYK